MSDGLGSMFHEFMDDMLIREENVGEKRGGRDQ
jgi:hypothetical protein